jgi:hypothetical protein
MADRNVVRRLQDTSESRKAGLPVKWAFSPAIGFGPSRSCFRVGVTQAEERARFRSTRWRQIVKVEGITSNAAPLCGRLTR